MTWWTGLVTFFLTLLPRMLLRRSARSPRPSDASSPIALVATALAGGARRARCLVLIVATQRTGATTS